ncbi:serine/threonine-protein kinase [Streptomyces roseifaciens]
MRRSTDGTERVVTAGAANGDELIGKVLGGRYRVTAMIGRGGMGVVARAVDELLNREVAVKVLRAFTDSAEAELLDLRTRMQREAQAAARIRHGGVVTVHDVTEEQGLPVIVMELVDGPSLDDVLGERGTLEPHEAAAIGAKLMDALDAAHRAGVLHRDVKPGNVLLERGERSETGVPSAGGWGRVVLTDFGIASMEASGDEAMAKLTQSGQLVGSLDYLPPERAQGREPGPASDIWSLGMTLYAAVEGTSPFRRTSVWSTLSAIVTEPLPQPRRAGALAPVLQALMAKEPEHRPTADQAREMLERVAAGTAATNTASAAHTVHTANLMPQAPGPGPAPSPVPTQAVAAAPPPGFGAAPSFTGPFQQPAPQHSLGPSLQSPPPPAPQPFPPSPYAGHPAPGPLHTQPPQSPHSPQPPHLPQPGPGGGSGAPVVGHAPAAGHAPAGGHAAPTPPAGPRRAPAADRGRRRSRTLVAAAAALVVLAGGGVTYALTGNGGKKNDEPPAAAPAAAGSPSAGERPNEGGVATGLHSPGASPSASPSKNPSGSPSSSASPSAKPSASSAKPSSSVPTTCSGWSHHDPKPGTYGYVSGDRHVLNGPYKVCGSVAAAKSGTKVWFHCSVENSYGHKWLYVRIEGTKSAGWMSGDSIIRQSGQTVRC